MEKQNKNIAILSQKLLLVGESQRLRILCCLFKKKHSCVSEIALELNESIATVSHHLQTLARKKIVTSKRDGKKICYSIKVSDFTTDLERLICKYK